MGTVEDSDPGGINGERKAHEAAKAHRHGGGLPHWIIALGVVSLALAGFIAMKPGSLTAVHGAYALCSNEANKVYTVDGNNTQTQCIVVKNGYIVNTGSLKAIKAQWRSSGSGLSDLETRFIQPGAIIIPGISDSHAHLLEYGATQQLPLEGAKTIPEAVARIREYILSTPEILNDPSVTITGGGWDHTIWPNGSFPTAADLDADNIVRGRHVVLQSKDCHALWVSSKALETSLPFPQEVDGGVVVRDELGNPSGVLLDNAQEFLKQPEVTENDRLRYFKVAVRDAHRLGITSMHDAGLNPASLAFFKRQAEIATLPLRIYAMSYFDETEPYWGNTTSLVVGASNGRLSARSVKIFADGALRTGGAALYGPYHDQPSTTGFMRLDPAVLYTFIPQFLRDGWQVNVHAIGDRANAIVLDAFEKSLEGANVSELRPRLEHAQMMTTADVGRLGKLGVIASIQPAHAISDMWYAQDRLGPERIKNLYAFRSFIDNGARITLGSDTPVESMDPLAGFYAAVTRKSPTGESPHGPNGWFPEQCLSRQEALRGMTIDPAYASFTEDSLGSLEVGKRADFTILSQDIMEVAPEHILDTKVHATVIDGIAVYGSF